MTTKHDYAKALKECEAALERMLAVNIAGSDFADLYDEAITREKAIIHALKLADKLMSGPSPEVHHLINRAFDLHPEDNPSTMFAFKAMRDQMLKEVE